MNILRRWLNLRLRQDWTWLSARQRPTLALKQPIRPGWYMLTVLLQTEQRRSRGLFNRTQGRILISGKLRRRVVRIAPGHGHCTLELLGINGDAQISKLRLTPQPFCRVRRLLAKKLIKLHPLYNNNYLRQRSFAQQWWDYNHLLSRPNFPLIGYDEWIQRVEVPALIEEERKILSRSPETVNQPNVTFAIWLWGERNDKPGCQRSIDSLNSQSSGPYRLLPADDQLQQGDPETWVILLQVGDALPPHALRQFSSIILDQPEACVIYADEDRMSSIGRRHSPQFKPAWNPDLLYSDASYSHSWLIRSDHCWRACQVLSDNGAETSLYAIVLEATAGCELEQILHVPQILYHRLQRDQDRRSSAQTAATLEAFFARHGQPIRVSFHASGGHVVHWPLPDPPPLVSVIIPTRDHGDLLRCCLNSLSEHAQGNPPTEIIIIDNGSSEPETLEYLANLEQKPNIRILRRPGPFNYSALNNEAVNLAQGELIALMNNDVEATHAGWLATMAAQALRPEIGAVGAKLLFDDGTVQHAGVLLGIGGVAGHAHKYLDANDNGYQMRLRFVHNVSAVTAATLVIRRSVFLKVDGFDAKKFAVNYNDVDFCLRLLRAGYRNVFCPDAVLIHHESKSRGTPTEKLAFQQWQRERKAMQSRWGDLLCADPNYSPHLTMQEENLSLSLRSVAADARTAKPLSLL